MNIFIIGMTGVGKTNLGCWLATKLAYSFVDLDQEIALRTGKSAAKWYQEDVLRFRNLELEILQEIASSPVDQVVATGGGTVCSSEALCFINERKSRGDQVVWLQASLETLLRRISDYNRPLFRGENPKERLKSLVLNRTPFYKQAANLIIPTDAMTVEAVGLHLLRKLEEKGAF